DELQEELLSTRGRQVERRGQLVAREHLPPQAVAVLLVAVRPKRIAARMLDLQHLGAEVAEQRRGERAGDDGREIDDPDALERAGGVCIGRAHSSAKILPTEPSVLLATTIAASSTASTTCSSVAPWSIARLACARTASGATPAEMSSAITS